MDIVASQSSAAFRVLVGTNSFDTVGINITADHGVLVATAGGDRIASGEVKVCGSFFLCCDGNITFMLFGFLLHIWFRFDLDG